MKPLLDSLTVWLVVAVRHWLRVLAFTFILFACVALGEPRTGDWWAVTKGLAVGFVVGVAFVFPDEFNEAIRR